MRVSIDHRTSPAKQAQIIDWLAANYAAALKGLPQPDPGVLVDDVAWGTVAGNYIALAIRADQDKRIFDAAMVAFFRLATRYRGTLSMISRVSIKGSAPAYPYLTIGDFKVNLDRITKDLEPGEEVAERDDRDYHLRTAEALSIRLAGEKGTYLGREEAILAALAAWDAAGADQGEEARDRYEAALRFALQVHDFRAYPHAGIAESGQRAAA